MTERERRILENLKKDFEEHEEECLNLMEFLEKHKFEYEKTIVDIKRNIYRQCLTKLTMALYDIDQLKGKEL